MENEPIKNDGEESSTEPSQFTSSASHNKSEGSPYLIPSSIVIAGLLVALAVLYNGGSLSGSRASVSSASDTNTNSAPSDLAKNMKPVTSADHILGNPNAKIKIVEYSDLECPFCKQFHPTLERIMSEYGKDGKVAWVYRQFPLDSIHPRSPKESEASECAAELGGNSKFWDFINRVYAVTPSNNGLDPAQLPVIAQYVGLDQAKFNACLSSGKYTSKVTDSVNDAIASGGTGTPYSIILANGKATPVSGALPYDQFKQLIDQALKN